MSDVVGFNLVREWFAFNISARMIYVTLTDIATLPYKNIRHLRFQESH